MARAVRFNEYGPADVLYIADVEVPEPAEGQLRVRVKAAGINPFDYKVRNGVMSSSLKVSFPAGLGSDLAGVVEAVGPGVTEFAVGDEVLGRSAVRGSQAQYALAKPAGLVKKPAEISWEVAGGLNVVGTTAYATVAAVDVKLGETLLISGASGGVGSLATQLAVARGATVLGVASARNAEFVQSLGAIAVPYGEALSQRLVDAAPTGRIDAAIDAAGHGTVELAIELGIAPERIDTIADHAAVQRFAGVQDKGGAAAPLPQALQELSELIAAGKLTVRIDSSFALNDVQAAYRRLEHDSPAGKIVLIP